MTLVDVLCVLLIVFTFKKERSLTFEVIHDYKTFLKCGRFFRAVLCIKILFLRFVDRVAGLVLLVIKDFNVPSNYCVILISFFL